MAAARDNQRWDLTHDPEAKPLGCNGKYGRSGMERHRYHGEEICEPCRESGRHYDRERRRGQKYPRTLYPCGTYQAAARHKRKGEEVDYPCKVAYAERNTRDTRAKRARARAKLAA